MSSNPGWFDAFRDNGGPPLYLNVNRTASLIDSRIFFIILGFIAAVISFLIVLPGIRKEKFSTFVIVTVTLFIGCTIGVAYYGTSWHIAEASISSPYRAFSKQKIFADVGVYIGLQSVNITLKAKVIHKNAEDINYNERFYWIGATDMKQEYQAALAKGLPYPILTISEYLSKSDEGFCWGRKYRLAGYYAATLLIMAFCLWILMIILLCAVPRYGIYALQATGALMITTNAIYTLLLPPNPLRIPFEGGVLSFSYGWCYWLVLGAGSAAVTIGSILVIIDTLFPNKFSTILEVDYDTPYRYFVGNDAHLFGGLANTTNGCQHTAASITNSAATESTCCGNSSHTRHCHGLGVGVASKPVSKQKSDASVSTTESYPVTRFNSHSRKASLVVNSNLVQSNTNIQNKQNLHSSPSPPPPSSSPSSNIVSTRATIERQGCDNEAFEKENNEQLILQQQQQQQQQNQQQQHHNHHHQQQHKQQSSQNENIISDKEIDLGSPSDQHNNSNNKLDANDNGEISTELVHGKRAVSLSNFGKFTARQQREKASSISQSRAGQVTSPSTLPGTHL